MQKICFVNAIKGTAESFLKPHFRNLCRKYEVHYVACDVENGEDPSFPGIICHQIDIRRPISLYADINALMAMVKLFKKEKFVAVHSLTPKAGLVCSVAGKLTGVNHRIHTITGQVWATKTGVMRMLLRAMDHVIVHCANCILVDGESQRQYLISEGILKDNNSRVLANGGLIGVDLQRFCPQSEYRDSYRQQIGISDDHFVFAFLGRLNADKGIRELMSAFDRLVGTTRHQRPYLILIGRDEDNMSATFSNYTHIKPHENFCYYGSTPIPERVMQAADAFVLPTYREGFPQSPLEAAALELPIIISDIYGTKASIVDNETGIRCQAQDEDSLYSAMQHLLDNKEVAKQMGKRGRAYIQENFSQDIVEKAWIDFYEQLLE